MKKWVLRWWLARWWLIGMVVMILAISFKFLSLFESLQIIITYTLVLVTAEYAKSTAQQAKANEKMVEEMELTRKMQNRPSIVAYFDNQQSNLLDLVIKNIGYGTAKDVKLKISPPLHDHNNLDISALSLFKQGITFFPPNREFRQIIGVSTQFFGEDAKRPLKYDLTISYSDIEGNRIPDQSIPLDLSVYRNLPIHRDSDIDKLTKEVANLARKLRVD